MADEKPQGYYIPTHPSVMTPMLVLGGEREPMMMWALLCAVAVFGVWHWLSALVGIVAWCTGSVLIRQMAEVDPQLCRVAIRALRYRRLYPAAGPYPGVPRTWCYLL